MAVTVHIPSALRNECAGESTVTLEVSAVTRLEVLLDELAARHPRFDRRIRDDRGRLRRFVNIFVGRDESRALAGMDTEVPDGAEVRIIPSVAGG